MEKKISFEHVSISYKNNKVLNDFCFSFHEQQSVCLIGTNGCGKSSLLKAVSGQILYEGDILKTSTTACINQLSFKKDATIFQYLNYVDLSKKDQKFVNDYLKLNSLHYSVLTLSEFFKLKVLLLEALLKHPKFLFLDDILSAFLEKDKIELWKLLKSLSITFFYVTSDIEDVMFSDYLLILNSNGIVMEGSTLSVLKEEKIMKRLGFSLPFLFDLSIQLKNYNLIDDYFIKEKELTDALWK